MELLSPSDSIPIPYVGSFPNTNWTFYNAVLILSTWRRNQIPPVKGSVPQDCPPLWMPIRSPDCWAFLVVQWWRIRLPMQETQVPWSGKIPQALEQQDLCAATIEPVLESLGTPSTKPMCCNYWSLSSLKPMFCNKKNHCREAHSPKTESSPCLQQLKKNPCSNKDPA